MWQLALAVLSLIFMSPAASGWRSEHEVAHDDSSDAAETEPLVVDDEAAVRGDQPERRLILIDVLTGLLHHMSADARPSRPAQTDDKGSRLLPRT
jgi:hypothetical protein